VNPFWALPCVFALACAQSPEAVDDAALADAAVPDGAVAGAPCDDHLDCAGACLEDPLGAGLRCFPPCDGTDACPSGSTCVREGGAAGCVADPAPALGAGEDCAGGGRCERGLVCSPDHPDGPRCASSCEGEGCPAGTRCAPESVAPRACLPPAAAVFQCPFTECGRADLLCVEARCVAPCGDAGVDCPGGGICSARQGDGALYCSPRGDVGVGGGCASGGQAACAEGLVCLGRGPGDPDAVCSVACRDHEECAEACAGCAEDEVACRRPRGQSSTACLPAPFGRGDESGAAGDPCRAHGDTDCQAALDCVAGVAGSVVCAARCAGACDSGFVCAERLDDLPHCLPGDDAGAPGTPCPSGGGCPEICLGERPDERYCTVSCPDDLCPRGFGCSAGVCRLGVERRAALGEPCPGAGPTACVSGLCAVAPRTGESVCSVRCDDGGCPDGFECEALDADALCFAPTD